MKRGKFIAFEGNDGCGKSTQMELLSQYLKKEHGITVKRFDIPFHGSRQAKLVDDYLSGSLGHLTVCQIAALYAIDQSITYTMENGINESLDRGEWVITSRWYYSNLAYRSAQVLLESETFSERNGITEEQKIELIPFRIDTELIREIEDLTTIFLGAGKPDTVLYMKMGKGARECLLEKRGEPKDVHEQNDRLLSVVDAMYDYMYVTRRYNMAMIDCGTDVPFSKSMIQGMIRIWINSLIEDYKATT